ASRRKQSSPAAASVPVGRGWWPFCCLMMSLFFLAMQVQGQCILQLSYYVDYLLPIALLALCALFRDALDRLRPAQFLALLTLLVGAFVAHRLRLTPMLLPV